MSHLLPKPEDLLNEINTHEFTFLRAKHALQENNEITHELEMVRGQFGKQKQKFIALESKRALLEMLNRNSLLHHTPDQMDTLEQEAQTVRKQITEVREETRVVKENVQEVLKNISKHWYPFIQVKEAFESTFDVGKSQKNRINYDEIVALNDVSDAYGKSSAEELELDNETSSMLVLQRQRDVAERLSNQTNELEEQQHENLQHLQRLQEEIESRGKVIQGQNAQIKENSPQQPRAELQLRELEALRKLTQSMGGVEVESFHGNSLALKFPAIHVTDTEISQEALVIVKLSQTKTGHMDIVDAHLTISGMPVEPNAIKDILDYAIETQDISFLVTQIQSRLYFK